MALKGIDISEHQGNIDFSKVANEVDFVILRTGYGTIEDKQFANYVSKCNMYKIPIRGVYNFSYALNENQALSEAKFVVNLIEKYKLGKDVIVFQDFEYDTVSYASRNGIKLGPSQCNKHTKIFCEYVELKGYKAGIYCNIDYYKNMYEKSLLDKYVFWLAHYNGGSKPAYECLYHQYGSNGKISGINGNVDVNLYYGENASALPGKEEYKMVKPVDYKQYDSRWGNNDYSTVGEKTNITQSGCGPTCAAMVIATIKDKYVTPATTAKWALLNGYKVRGGGTANAYFVRQFDAYGIKSEYISGYGYHNTLDPIHKKAKEELKKGNWLIANPGQGLWTSGGHFILVYGIDDDENVYINDPASTNPQRLKNTFQKLAYDTKCYWAITVPESIKKNGATDRDSSGGESPTTKAYLSLKDVGADVGVMQKMLKKLGYYTGEADNSFGLKTEEALKKYQKAYKLEVDGFYGPLTKSSLEKSYNLKIASDNKNTYKVGNTYTLKYDMKVRSGAGTACSWKKRTELTPDGQKNCYKENNYAVLKYGTKVTCIAIKKISDSEIWMQIPSGWVAAVFGGITYIN